MSENVLQSRDYDFWTNLAIKNNRSLQSYLVAIEKDCNHIWSNSVFRLQSYLVPLVMKIAFILGPHSDHHCNHIWSLLKNYCNHKWSSRIKIKGVALHWVKQPNKGFIFLCSRKFNHFSNLECTNWVKNCWILSQKMENVRIWRKCFQMLKMLKN